MKECVYIYCGDGKGKTTVAIGLTVQTAGRGERVMIARFLKTEDSGEVKVLHSIPGITALPCERTFGFYFQMTEEQEREVVLHYESFLGRVWSMTVETHADMMILDKIVVSCSCHLVEEKRLLDLLDPRPKQLELIMTGRSPSEALQTRTDYASEIEKIKHSFDSGVMVREGIEY